MDKHKTVYLENIEVKNFRGIEESTFEFDEGTNLIIGDNGSGKTSLIRAIRASLGQLVKELSTVNEAVRDEEDVRIDTRSIGEATADIRRCYPIELKGKVNIYDDEYNLTYVQGRE